MEFEYQPSNNIDVHVSPTAMTVVSIRIVGNLNGERTEATGHLFGTVHQEVKTGYVNGEYVDFDVYFLPSTESRQAFVSFRLVDMEGEEYETPEAEYLYFNVIAEQPYSYGSMPSITFLENVIEVGAESGHTYNTVYKSNIASFTASTSASWLRIAGDASGSTIEVEYDANEGEARSANVVFEALERTSNPFARTFIYYFTVSQAEADAEPIDGTLSFEKRNATIQSGGGFFDFAYTTENIVGYPTFTSDSSWIYPRDVDEGNVSIFIPVNNGVERNGKLIARATDENGNELMASVDIFQLSDLYMPSIELSSDSINVSYSADTSNSVTYSVTNCDHMVVWSDDDWIDVDDRSEMPSFGRISFNYSANTYASRVGYITIRNYGDNEIYTEAVLTVVQQEVPNWQSLPRCEFDTTAVQLSTWASSSGTVGYVLYNVQQGREIAVVEDSSKGAAAILESGELSWYMYANPTNEERTLNVGIEFYSTGGTAYRALVRLVQPAPADIEEVPIWKDTEARIEDSEGTYKEYTIESNGIVLHRGRTYGNPSYVLVNGILRNYMEESFEPRREGIQDNGGYIGCSLSVNGVPKYYYNVFNDWSYEDIGSNVLSFPIRDKVVVGQYLPQSFKAVGGGILYADGSSYQMSNGIYTYSKRVGDMSPISYRLGDESYSIEPTEACSDFVLYYRNLYGGYDWFVFNACIRTDTFERSTYNTRALNTEPLHKRKVYRNEKVVRYTLTTDYLKDWEMEEFARHLASSNDCYLHFIGSDEVLPVNITTGSIRYTTFKSNGRRFFTASIDVEVSREMLAKG